MYVNKSNTYSITYTKPNLVNLRAFPFQIEGSRNIVARAASQYKCIGAILLNDKDGTLISGLTLSQDPKRCLRYLAIHHCALMLLDFRSLLQALV